MSNLKDVQLSLKLLSVLEVATRCHVQRYVFRVPRRISLRGVRRGLGGCGARAVLLYQVRYERCYTARETNMTMENQSFEDVSPTKNDDFPFSHVSFRWGTVARHL